MEGKSKKAKFSSECNVSPQTEMMDEEDIEYTHVKNEEDIEYTNVKEEQDKWWRALVTGQGALTESEYETLIKRSVCEIVIHI